MQSAFDKAMERFGGEIRTYSEEQKEKFAEIDKVYDAKVAQAKFDADARLQAAAGEPQRQEQILEDLAVELASLEQRRQREKEKVRVPEAD